MRRAGRRPRLEAPPRRATAPEGGTVLDVTAAANRSVDGARVRIFDSHDAPADPALVHLVADGVAGVDLAAPAVVLPDFHHKSSMEMPSSIAVATTETIRPTFTSASVNCGMALIALEAERPDRAAIESFFRGVRERYPFPRSGRRELSAREVARCAMEGAGFAVDRFGASPDDALAMETGGFLDPEPYGGVDRMRRQLPRLILELSRLRFGAIGPSNHFVELQEVEEVLQPAAADVLGLRVGQLTLQYHAGGGMLTSLIGRMYGRRKSYPRPVRAVMAVQKPLTHLATARSREALALRRQLYFAGSCPPVARDSDEGRRVMLGNVAAMNYGWAFRLTTYTELCDIARRTLGASDYHLVTDSPHNSIYEENVGGVTALVHRHNACRAWTPQQLAGHPLFATTGQPLLLPGTNRTSSYVCIPGESAADSLYSACHGAGTLIDSFAETGLSLTDAKRRSTLRFRYDDGAPEEIMHLDDRGIDEALAILVRNGLVQPVARLRPLAGLT
jgi:RNA-splicing ligase RtcB